MSQRGLSLSPVEPHKQARNPDVPASSSETCHISAEKKKNLNQQRCSHDEPRFFFSFKFFFIWTFWSLDMVELWRIISWTVECAGAGTVTTAEEWMLGSCQNPWFCSDICNVFCCQQSTFGFNICFAHWVHPKISSSALHLGTPQSKNAQAGNSSNKNYNIQWYCCFTGHPLNARSWI